MALSKSEIRSVLCEVLDNEVSKLPKDVAKKVKRSTGSKYDYWELKKYGTFLRIYASDGLDISARVQTVNTNLESRSVRVMGPFDAFDDLTAGELKEDARFFVECELSLKETIQAFYDINYCWEGNSSYHDWITEQWVKEWMMRFAMDDINAVRLANDIGTRYLDTSFALLCSVKRGLENGNDVEKQSTQSYWRCRPQIKKPTCDGCTLYDQCSLSMKREGGLDNERL